MMTSADLRGFVPAIVTPFDAAGEIMEDAFVEILEWLIGRGASAVCVAGDNGESWALSAEERARLTRLAADRVGGPGGPVKILTGCSAPTFSACLEYALAAQSGGADALLSMPQTYVLHATEAELLARFEKLAAHTQLPIVLYNSPRRAGLSLSVEQIGALFDLAPVIGIKESHRDFFHHTRLLERYRERVSVMIGPCHYIMPGLRLGAGGFIASGPELLAYSPADLPAIATGVAGSGSGSAEHSPEAFQRAHYHLTALYELLMGTATWPAALKAALELLGLPAGVPRDPVLPATPADCDKIRAVFDRLEIPRQ